MWSLQHPMGLNICSRTDTWSSINKAHESPGKAQVKLVLFQTIYKVHALAASKGPVEYFNPKTMPHSLPRPEGSTRAAGCSCGVPKCTRDNHRSDLLHAQRTKMDVAVLCQKSWISELVFLFCKPAQENQSQGP